MKKAILILLLIVCLAAPASAADAKFIYFGGTAFNSTSLDVTLYGPGNAFDGNTATFWSSESNQPQYIGYDFNATTTHKVSKYVLYPRYGSGLGSYSATEFRFEASNDNSSWIVLDYKTGLTWSDNTAKTFNSFTQSVNISSYRYYRVYTMTGGTANYAQFSEIELWGEDIPPDTTPPDSITSLTNTTANCENITWTWTNPGGSLNADYSHLYSLKNDAWIGNYSNTSAAATWLSLTNNTQYTMSTKTVDLKYNMNSTWVNASSTTAVCSAPTPTPTPTPTPAPTAVPGTQWCGLQSIYFNHGYAILPAGYESLNVTPPDPPEIDENVTVKASTSPKLIDSYISPQGYPGVTSIAAGTRTYNMYGYVGGAAGITRFNVTLHTRDITGLETFHYQAYSDDINDLSVANQQFSFSHPQINMATTDRLVIRVYADTDAASDKVVHWIYQGTTHSSRVDSAYFNCATTTPTIIPTWQPEINPPTDYKTDPWMLIEDWWFVPVTIAAFMIIFGKW